MSLFDQAGQTNPEDQTDGFLAAEFRANVQMKVAALEDNKKTIARWFWRLLLAFNLILWSIALPIAALLLLP